MWHPKIDEAASEAEDVARWLEGRRLERVAHGSLYDEKLRMQVQAHQFDLLIALGGDGTMLRAGHLCARADLPLLGINMGRFGFLTEVQRDRWRTIMPELLDGRFWLEKRMMLKAEHIREEQFLDSYEVLNEVVVCRGQMVRPIRLSTNVDGYPLTSLVADGLIAATPTGSTAYALAASGPIMPPELRNILIVPVAPHLSIDRAIILAEGSSVTISPYADNQAVMSVDGQAPISVLDGDTVLVEASEKTAKFMRFQERGYFYRNITRYMEQNPSIGGV